MFSKINKGEDILTEQDKSTFGGDVMNVAAIICHDFFKINRNR
jgi:hypothetical protein